MEIDDKVLEELLDEYEKAEGSLEEKLWEEIEPIRVALKIGYLKGLERAKRGSL